MDAGQIQNELNRIFREIFDDNSIQIRPEMTADDVHDWDSFNHINLIVAVETKFNIKFKTAELESLRNVGHLLEMIEKKIKK